jgi:hypothetical protein
MGFLNILSAHGLTAMSGFQTGVDAQDAGLVQSGFGESQELEGWFIARSGLITGVRLAFDCRQNGSNLLI